MAFPSVDPSAFGPMPAVMSQGFTQAPAPQQGGMFGADIAPWKQAVLMGLAGFMSRRSPQVSNSIIGGLQAQQMMKQKLAMAQQERQQQMQDQRDEFTFEQDYKRDHPLPVNNDTVADYTFWKSVLPPDQFQQYVANKVNPPQLMDVPGVGIVSVPRMAPQGAPTAPVGKLTPLGAGGPTPSASGGFR